LTTGDCVAAECDESSGGVKANGMHGDVSPATVAIGSCKHTAADFDAEAVPLSTFVLNGQDYSKERSMKVSSTHPGANAQLTTPLSSKAALLHSHGLTEPNACLVKYINRVAGSCVGGALHLLMLASWTGSGAMVYAVMLRRILQRSSGQWTDSASASSDL
jgi:hypothetical protein